MQRRLRVRHGFHQRHIRVQHILQNVLGVTRRAHAQQFHRGALRFHLLLQVGEHLHGVFQGIALGKLVALHHHLALVIHQDGLGGSGAAVDAHEGLDVLTGLEGVGNKFLGLVALLEFREFVFRFVKSAAALLLLLFQAAVR